MTPRAGERPATSTTEPAGSRENSRTLLPAAVVQREFSRLFARHGIDAHPVEVRQLARRFVRSGRSLADIEPLVLAYADPTGEKAARNVDRERGGRHG